MRSAQCKKMRKGPVRSFVISLDSELAQVRDKSIRLRWSDTTFALRHCEDVCNFDKPPGRHKRRLGCQSIQQGPRLWRHFIEKQPGHGDRTINHKRGGAHRRPSLMSSLTFNPLKD